MLRPRWLQKPPNGVRVDRSLPIADGLRAAWLFNENGGAPRDAYGGVLASMSGSVWGVGRLIHDTTSDRTVLASDSNQLLNISGGFSYVLGFRKRDTTVRDNLTVGIDAVTLSALCDLNIAYVDGNTYWSYGGVVNGTTRTQVANAGLTFTTDSVWIATTGSRGMDLWQNGNRLASNTANPTRTATTTPLLLGDRAGTNASDLSDYLFLYIYHRQLSVAEIATLSQQPYSLWARAPYVFFGSAGISFPTDLIDASDAAAVVAAESTPTLNIMDVVDVTDALPLALSDVAALTQETNALDVSDSIALGIADLAALVDSFVLSVTDTLPLALSEDVPQEWFTENPALLAMTWQEYVKSAGGAADALVIIWGEQHDSADTLTFQWVEISREVQKLSMVWREMPPMYTFHTASNIKFPSRRLLVT